MATRMRYGPRFKQDVVSAGYGYDAQLDATMRKDHMRMAAFQKNMPLHKRELIGYKAGEATKAKRAAISKPLNEARQIAEQRMAEAMRKVVGILEFHLEELIQTQKLSNTPALINQQAIHNAVVLLRTKCGMKFEPNEYDHHINLARLHLSEEQQLNERQLKMQEQRNEREARLRHIAERLIARPKGK